LNNHPGSQSALLLYSLASLLLLLGTAAAIVTSRLSGEIFGNDSAASLLERHFAALPLLRRTGDSILGLLFADFLLRWSI
jgi:hypothetical protein